MPQTSITDVRTVAVTVTDQDRALSFYVDTLGFEKRLDAPISPTMRWIEVAPPGAAPRSPSMAPTRPAPESTRASGSWFPTPRPSTPPCAEPDHRQRPHPVGRGAADVHRRRP